MSSPNFFDAFLTDAPKVPVKASSRAFRSAIEEALFHTYTRRNLESVLDEELRLQWPTEDRQPADGEEAIRLVVSATS